MVNSFLCSSTNYLDNRLLLNNLIIIMNHGDNEEDILDIEDVQKSSRDVPNKLETQTNSELLEIQSNSKFQNLNSNPTQSPGPP
jgi:hypothetical protein